MILPIEQSRCDFAVEALRHTGTLSLKAFGTSMLPTLWPGDVARVQLCAMEDVEPGDIVLCKRYDRFYLHRVTQKIAGSWLITRGDSMPSADPPVPPGHLLGKVTHIQNGEQDFVSIRKLSLRSRLVGRILGHSEVCMRLAMKFHAPFPPMTNPPLGDIAS